jgi:UDP-N-acetylmuramate--alanine ligase
MTTKNNNFKKAYFVGIGGIGMSALARYFKHKGVEVVGSDRDLNSEVVKGLISEGIEVYDQAKINNYDVLQKIHGSDCVIYTLAIPKDSIELQTANIHDIPTFTYAEMLGQVSEDSFTIAVAGTHGKTTTTAMTAEVAKNLNLDPNVIVGSFFNTKEATKTNFLPGESDLFIVEACEYGRSFLNLYPNILIITNLEEDHLDYYKDLDDIKQAFYDLAFKVGEEGYIVCDSSDPNLFEIVRDFGDKIVDYSEIVDKVPEMKVFGDHNKKNAAAAISAIQKYLYIQKSDIEIESDEVFDSVKDFTGTWRRMEYKGETENGVKVYDDYGHHPTEIKATIKAFKENFPNKKIATIFQPHLHSRTKMFFQEFIDTISEFDYSIIYPIYRARAEEDFSVSAELLVEEVNKKTGSTDKAVFMDSYDQIAEEIESLNDEWIVVLLGAGEIYQIADQLNLKK